jgi:peptide/nickel transport system substrate-binding protein
MKLIRFSTGARLTTALLSVALLATGRVSAAPPTTTVASTGGTTAQSASESTGATADQLRVGMVGVDLSNVDPGVGTALQVNSYIQEFLLKLGPTGDVEPNLAASFEQTDDVTYTYHLRPDVKFSSGRTMTAADVVASLNYLRKADFPESWRYSAVKDIVAKDDSTVVVTLNAPTVSWPYVLAMNGYIFDSQHQSEHPTDFGKPGVGVVGTGPYVLQSLDATNGVATLAANPNYWGGAPNINTVTLTNFADENSEALAFRTGDLDLAFPADVRTFEATANTTVTTVPGTRQGMFIMNVGVAPWNDVHVRRAVAYAINKEDIINVIGGNATPDVAIIPPAQLLSIASQDQIDKLMGELPAYAFDLDKAKAEMAQSATPTGFSGVLPTPNYGGFVDAAQAIAGELQQIGINLDVKVLSDPEYGNTFSVPHAENPVQYTYFNNNTPDPGGMPRLALSSSQMGPGMNNFADYSNPQVDDLIAKADATSDPAQRFDDYSQLLKIVGDDVPYVPLYAGNINVALSDGFAWPTFNAYSTDHTPFITQIEPK